MIRVLLDTHILIWWFLGSSDLPTRYREILQHSEATPDSNDVVGISIISYWEIAQLVQRGRVHLPISLDQWFKEIDDNPWFTVFPLDRSVILESTRLGPDFHKDPADRFIVGTARIENLRLMTVDQKINDSKTVAIC